MLALFIMTFVFVFRSKAFGIVIGVILSTNVLATALLLRPELMIFQLYGADEYEFVGLFHVIRQSNGTNCLANGNNRVYN